MSGLDIFSTALAVLPLFIQAIEYYKSSDNVFARYRNHDKELQRLVDDLTCERGIYHVGLEILFGKALKTWDKLEVDALLKLENRSERVEAYVETQLVSYLGNSREPVSLTMGRINKQLKFFDNKSKTLGYAVKQSPHNPKINRASKREWFSEVTSKINFSFSGQEFKKQLSDLKEHNRTLDFILRQAESRAPSFRSDARPFNQSLAHIRDATWKIYYCLSSACHTHGRHSTYLDLGDLQTTGQHPLEEGVNLAVQAYPQSYIDNHLIEMPFRFSVCSTCSTEKRGGFSIPEEKEEQRPQERTLKRKRSNNLLSLENHTEEKREKRLKDNNERHILGVKQLNLGDEFHCSAQESPEEWDFSAHADFCKRIRLRSQHLASLRDTNSLGYLNMGHKTELQVYPARNPAPCKHPQSLPELFLGRPKKRLLLHQLLHLATRVASAILFSNVSSLLSEDWARESIVFFDVAEDSWFRHPQLKVDLDNGGNRPSVQRTDGTMIRNPHTFSLGCFLIELVYRVPLNTLRNHFDQNVDGIDGPNTKHSLASRVCKSMAGKVGNKYMEVVRKCLQCDFGKGEDLERPVLQKVFHEEVISVLGGMEREQLAKNSDPTESDDDWI